MNIFAHSKPQHISAPKITDWSRYKKTPIHFSELVTRTVLPDPWEPIFLTEKAPFMPGWQKGEITAESLSEVFNANEYRITGVGLRTGNLSVPDIDCTDDELTEIINAVMIEVLGPGALYRRGSKGFAALYWNETPIGKLTIPFAKAGISHKIEVLGQGQHMAAFAKMKATDKSPAFSYLWLDGKSPLQQLLYELPRVNGEKLREFLEAVKGPLAAVGCEVGKITGGSVVERDPNAHESEYPEKVDSDRAQYATRIAWKSFLPAVENAGGDKRTYEAACLARDHNVSEDICFDLMTEPGGWNERCEPPWDSDELRDKIRNAYSYAKTPMGSKYQPDSYLMELFGLGEPDDIHLETKRTSTSQQKRRRFLPMNHYEQDNIPHETYIVEGWIAEKQIGWFYGPTGAYKTYDMLALSLALAAGHDHWCGLALATNGGKRKWRVIYISGEGGTALITERKKAWLQKHKLNSKDVEFYPITGNMPNMLRGGDVEALLDDITCPESPCPDPEIIVWDTYSRATPGADDNSTTDISTLINEVERMKNEKLPSLMFAAFLDHTGLDETRPRGTTGKGQNADAIIRINRPAGGAKLQSQWTPEKVRNGPLPEPFVITATLEEIDFRDVKGRTVKKTVPVFDVLGAKPSKSDKGGGPLSLYKATGTLTDTDLVRVLLDREKVGAKLTLLEVVEKAAQLVTLDGAPETRNGNFEKRLRNNLSKDTSAARKAREPLMDLFTWKSSKTGGVVFTFIGQGGKLGAWEEYNRLGTFSPSELNFEDEEPFDSLGEP